MDHSVQPANKIQDCGVADTYWGEFSQADQKELNRLLREEGIEAAKKYAREELNREAFIFGRARTDFLYYFDLTSDSVCLDCGAGTGIHSLNLARKAKEVHAFDLSRDRLECIELRSQVEGVANIKLYHSDFKTLPFQGEMFDAVAMNGVVEWLGVIHDHEDPRGDQVQVLRQIRGLMKPGGKLYIGIENRFAASYLRGYDHNKLHYTSYMPRFLADWITRLRKGHPYRTYTYGARGYRKLLQDSGFEPKKVTVYITHPGYNLPQYIIAHDDLSALRYFYTSFGRRHGLTGTVFQALIKLPLFLKFMRSVTWSYGIVAMK